MLRFDMHGLVFVNVYWQEICEELKFVKIC